MNIVKGEFESLTQRLSCPLTHYEVDETTHGRYFTESGTYMQKLRTRPGGKQSENPGLQVGRDGYVVVEWLRPNPGANGHVVMYGASFFGMTQWRTAAQIPRTSLASRLMFGSTRDGTLPAFSVPHRSS